MNIGIIGLGLIGGSLGIDLQMQGYTVFGVSRSLETCRIAQEIRAVHEARTDLQWLAQVVDIIFICTPLNQIVSTLERLTPHLRPTAIVTDVGSVKTPIVQECSALWSNFVGGHPMAGTADQGINAAQSKLFVNKPYVLTSTLDTPAESVEILDNIIRSLGANLYKCTPQEHDQAVAWISHLPVMVSASLIQACMSETEPRILDLSQKLASSGFASTSRVGGGNPELGVLMAQYNREAILRSLQQYRHNLDDLIHQIETEDWSNLRATLASTQQARKFFIKKPQFNQAIWNRVIFTLSFFIILFLSSFITS